MGDAGTLGNGMRCDRNRRDRQLSTARTAAVKVIPRFVTVPTAICAPIPKTAQRLYRGLSQVSNRVKIKFAAMNLKKLAKMIARKGKRGTQKCLLLIKYTLFEPKTRKTLLEC